MTASPKHRLFLALLVSLGSLTASAEKPKDVKPTLKPVDPPELVAKRADHLRSVQRILAPQLAAYLKTLESLQQQYLREGKTDAVLAVASEMGAIKDQLAQANAASDLSGQSPIQLQIDAAAYGDFKTNRTVDVTAYIQKAFTAGAPSVSIVRKDMMGARDPAPFVHKEFKITYTINGRRKEKVVKDPEGVLDFKQDLK